MLWILIAVAIVLLLVLGIGGYLYWHHADAPPVAEKAEPPAPPTFVTIAPMTVNLASGGQVLYIGLSLDVADAAAADTLQNHMPEVRNRLLITLSDKQADELTSAEAKRSMATTLRGVLAAPYRPGQKPVAINHVLFTDFIVQ